MNALYFLLHTNLPFSSVFEMAENKDFDKNIGHNNNHDDLKNENENDNIHAHNTNNTNQHQLHLSIDGIDSHIIITSYYDRHFVVISQLQKFGTLV